MKYTAFLVLFTCLLIQVFGLIIDDVCENCTVQEILIDDKDFLKYVKPTIKNITVEENSFVMISVVENKMATGSEWTFINAEEIVKSKLIDFLGVESGSVPECEEQNCDSKITYKFRILKKISNEKFPEIKLGYVRQWIKETEASNIVVKIDFEPECQVDGKPCCSNPNAPVYYTDEDGEWSVENDDWCAVVKKEKQTPKMIHYCKSEALGYPCCMNQTLVYEDSDGQWGIDNNNWCGLTTCIYTGEEPLCKNTTEVIFSEGNIGYGVENNDWCVLCL